MRRVFRLVPSSLHSMVASACPFVIYVCFMARRIRKRLIKDSRVVAHEEKRHLASERNEAAVGEIGTRSRYVLAKFSCFACVCNRGHGFTRAVATISLALFVYCAVDVLLAVHLRKRDVKAS